MPPSVAPTKPGSPPSRRLRRVEVGPFATFYFENFDTMWHQVHEMLYIERGGEAQIADELDAYNPLIPQGSELIATVMIEIEDAARRERELMRLGGIENHMFLAVGGAKLYGLPDPTRENTSPEGKASSVQFVRFPFTPAQKAKFRAPGGANRRRHRPPELPPHGGDARDRPRRARRRFRLTCHCEGRSDEAIFRGGGRSLRCARMTAAKSRFDLRRRQPTAPPRRAGRPRFRCARSSP